MFTVPTVVESGVDGIGHCYCYCRCMEEERDAESAEGVNIQTYYIMCLNNNNCKSQNQP